MKNNDPFDFGFSIVDESELKQYEQELTKQLEETKTVATNALEGLQQMYKPLLDNLKKDPKKNYIFWPDRTAIIEQFEKKVQEYIKKNSIT